jgi:hypothetical protein
MLGVGACGLRYTHRPDTVAAPLGRKFEDLMGGPVWNLPMIERISLIQTLMT